MGIAYANREYYLGAKAGFITESDIINNLPGSSISTSAILNTLEIPVSMKYYFWKRRLFLGLGTSAEFLLKQKDIVRITYSTEPAANLEYIPFYARDVNLSILAFLGYSQTIGKKFVVTLEPNYRYNLLKNEIMLFDTDQNFFSWGLSIGLFYKIQ